MIAKNNETYFFYPNYEKILSIIEPKSKVLDLGCGTGELLQRLINEKNVLGRGVEIDEKNIIKCIAKGLSVFQGNIDEGLAEYHDKSYDYVILNKTLQVTHKPEFVIKEMLRVGKKAIVSFPNFGHYSIRLNLMFTGKMPKTEILPFEWYDTPNIRLLTIKDFKTFCTKYSFKILDCECLSRTGRKIKFCFLSNLFAQEGLFVISYKKI
ncbi:methionine biosynthesis protein MetW [bacterium]|nr:methionine biosynthesis protein MetW [bacterium]